MRGKLSGRPFLARDQLAAASDSLVQIINVLRTFLQPVLTRTEVASWSPGGPLDFGAGCLVMTFTCLQDLTSNASKLGTPERLSFQQLLNPRMIFVALASHKKSHFPTELGTRVDC